FFFQAEDGIRDPLVTGVQTCALPISLHSTAGSDSADFGTGHCQTPPADPDPAKSADTSPRWCSGTPHHVHSIDTPTLALAVPQRSEERRVGKECRSRCSTKQKKKRKR